MSAPKLGNEIEHGPFVTDDENVLQVLAMGTCAAKRMPCEVTTEDRDRRARRQRQNNVASRDLCLEKVGDDRDDGNEPDCCIDDATIFFRTGREESRLVGAAGRNRKDPKRGKQECSPPVQRGSGTFGDPETRQLGNDRACKRSGDVY